MNRPGFGILGLMVACAAYSMPLHAQYETDARSKDYRTHDMVQSQMSDDMLRRLNTVARQGASLPLPAALQMTLDSARSLWGITGVSAAMIMPGYGLWLGTSGYSDPTVHDTITSDMIFGIASNTKTYVAALMLKLQEEGILSLDDPLHKWLPTYRRDQYQYIDSNITIRQLLGHTSGVAEYATNAWVLAKQADPDRFWMPESLLARFLGPPRFAAGSAFEYTNTNYLLAGLIINAATSSSLSTQLHQRILTPLNLSSTFLAIEDGLPVNRAHPWGSYWGGITDLYSYAFVSHYSSILACGGMFSNPENMVRWASGLFGGRLLNAASLDQMLAFTPQSGGRYGLGVSPWKYWGNTLLYHTGDTPGYESVTEFFPAMRLSLATTQNSNRGEEYQDHIAFPLFNTYLLYHIRDFSADRVYYRPGLDTVWLRAHVSNPNAHPLTVRAYLVANGTVLDSLLLCDDGLHRDSIAGDGVWGASWKAPASENLFNATVVRYDPLDSTYLKRDAGFTTAGPVVVDSIATRRTTGSYVRVDLWLRNLGRDCVIPSIKAVLRTTDPVVDSFIVNNRSFGNLGPGQRTGVGVVFYFTADTSVHTADISLTVDVSSNDQFYWTSETIARLTTGVIASDLSLPREYRLDQNYPNPFNPSTAISYQLPVVSNVRLAVYDILGREVSVLVNERKNAGSYEVKFDAAGLSSGVYVYRIQAGDFVQAKKFVVLK